MINRIFITLLLCFFINTIKAQVVHFFQDGTDDLYYDQGIVDEDNIGDSKFESTHVTGLPQFGNKIPCSTTRYMGNTSLRFTYTSAANGQWRALVLRNDWAAINISTMDSLSFYIYSENPITNTSLPLIGVTAINGTGAEESSQAYSLSAHYLKNIEANTWTKINFPLNQLFDDSSNSGLDFTQTKAIFFQQSEFDGSTKTILIDEISVFKHYDNLPEVENLVLTGYDSHVELTWDTPLDYLTYNIYASFDGGVNYELRASNIEENFYYDFFPSTAKNTTIHYQVTTSTQDLESNPIKDVVSVSDFTEEQLLEMVQEYTFRYFWEGAHQNSGMALERQHGSNKIVASGASGMSLMTMIVAHERNWRDKSDIIDRVLQMLNFLENCDRFHGAFSHWYNGDTGETIRFGPKDDGGDIVETAYVAVGLIAVKNYFSDETDNRQTQIREIADRLWREIEWTWYQNGEDVLWWHWSPNYGWDLAMRIQGRKGSYSETMIAYVIAGCSPTYPISKDVYVKGWTDNGNFVNPRNFYGYEITQNIDWGGQAFWTQYSFLGVNPKGLKDQYGDYWKELSNCVNIHVEYAKDNPKGFRNYNENCWGITASADPYVGYCGHWPRHQYLDNGTISPTGAIGNYPYAPEAALKALKYFYQERGAELWGQYGFLGGLNDNMDRVDDFLPWYESNPDFGNITYYDIEINDNTWIENDYIGIDQGPMVIMIENHRTGLLWDIVSKDEDVQNGLQSLGFEYSTGVDDIAEGNISIYPNPSKGVFQINTDIPEGQKWNMNIYSINGEIVKSIQSNISNTTIDCTDLANGIYIIHFINNQKQYQTKLLIRK